VEIRVSIVEIGVIIILMVLVNKLILMVMFMKENIRIIINMVLLNTLILMVVFMKENIRIIRFMILVNTLILMVMFIMMVYGIIILEL
jgi:hypothetical protein